MSRQLSRLPRQRWTSFAHWLFLVLCKLSCVLGCLLTCLFLTVEATPKRVARYEAESVRAATAKSADEAGAKSFSEAEELRARWEQDALRQSIKIYKKAAQEWSSVAPDKAVVALRSAGDIHFMFSEYSSALKEYESALGLSRDLIEKLELFNSIGYVYIFLGQNEKALGLQTTVMRDLNRLPASTDHVRKVNLQAQAINNIGEIKYGLGDLKNSLKYFDDALKLWTSVNNQRGMALAHINFGYSYGDSGDLLEASSHYSQSLAISREIGDLRAEAAARAALGVVYVSLGAKQRALDSRFEALRIFRQIGNDQGAATAINGIAEVHEELGDYAKALESYRAALDIYANIKSRGFVALNKYCIGRVYFAMKQPAAARDAYEEALSISREVGDQQIEAHTLKALGNLERSEGNDRVALQQFHKVMAVYRKIGDRRNQAYALNSIGQVYDSLDQPKKALACFSRALEEIRATKDGRGEVETLYNLARVKKKQGNLNQALAFIREGVRIVEASRVRIDSNDLRTLYFAREHKHYELLVDLLMQLHKQEPREEYVTAAFLASEHARARSLLDIRTSDGGESNPGRNGLIQRGFELSRLIDSKTEYQTRLLSAKHTPAEAQAVSDEVLRLSTEYEAIQSEIRQHSPRYAAMVQRRDITLAQIQSQLDRDTLLLEFMLGDERSYVWAVTQSSINGYELPSRSILEKNAAELYGLLVTRQMAYEKRSSEMPVSVELSDEQSAIKSMALSEALLGPVAERLGSMRLLLITDGALQYIPFEALPVPRRDALESQAKGDTKPLLIDDHEVVMLPSASLMVAINHETKRETPRRMIAIFADPVFGNTDPRVAQPGMQTGPTTEENVLFAKVSRTLNDGTERSSIPRLPGSLREAKAIVDLVPSGEATMASGFDANRERVMGEESKEYRILHFATHGIIDSETPEASGLLLSMLDRSGNPQNGYLRLGDIYALDVRADLVVLSACRTYLGQNVQGEGLIGLSRGFMCAGSRSVVASLWKVDDEATARLMSDFYKAMWSDRLPPAAALRRAKLNMRENRQWRAPYFWAAFVFQGSYDGALVPPNDKTKHTTILIASTILLMALLGLWIGRRLLGRN
jgi:CHAT domain-containing protein/tetratricopeptide (TPR) repeat protein